MLADTGLDKLGELRADGGMTKNDLLMQVLGAPGRAARELRDHAPLGA
jgi:glycerol kinase